MLLRQLCAALTLLSPLPDGADLAVTSLCYDSRLADAGSLFFCLRGKVTDGHRFAAGAYRHGCRAFVAEEPLELPDDALQLQVSDSRAALADAAALFYGHPEREIRLIGLTGTKGKTTTALLIRGILESEGIPCGYIGTNGVYYGRRHEATANSTPESVEIYRILRCMADCGIRVCAVEVSSQALWMGRVRGLSFDTTLFLNLSRDHIGGVEHPDLAHYRDSKRRLFSEHTAEAMILNADDPLSPYMAEVCPAPVTAFGITECSDAPLPRFRGTQLRSTRRDGRFGMTFRLSCGDRTVCREVFLPMPGAYNVQNALAALAVVCDRFGVSPLRAARALAGVTVPGRFETLTIPTLPDVTFIIDYAHNGASLTAVLEALGGYAPGRLICLFGSVGGRSRERRRDLALAAAGRCDLCILTSDNPGAEPPESILSEIDAAFPENACPRLLIPDRAEAIREAVRMAEPGDVVLLAGKGHERYQLIGTDHIPFCESDILREAAEELAREHVEV